MAMDILADDEKALNAPDPKYQPQHNDSLSMVTDVAQYAVATMLVLLVIFVAIVAFKHISKSYMIDWQKLGILIFAAFGLSLTGYISVYGFGSLSRLVYTLSLYDYMISLLVLGLIFFFSLIKKN